jgi:uncharacterized protein (TIGR03435 family)
MRYTAAVLAVALAAPVVVRAQNSAAGAGALHFDAASIKPSSPDPRGPGPRGTDLFSRTGITLRQLMVYAWDLPSHRIVGGPSWVDADRFDVLAKVNAVPTIPQMRALVQQLLTERFGLRVHREMREGPIYNLVFARADHRLGPGLTPAEIDCTPFVTGRRPMSESPTTRLANGTALPRCGMTTLTARPDGSETAKVSGYSLPRLADFLERIVRRPVVDKTGIQEAFDIEFTYVDESFQPPPGAARLPADGPSVSTALPEQLGLKFESAKGPAEFVVVDAAEKPSPN